MISDRELADLAARAYRKRTYAAGGVEALAVVRGGTLFAAFRGTERDGRDILRDLRALPWWDRRLGWCHAGFLKGVRRIWPALVVALGAHEGPVVFTGHSKGGAEATVAAAMMTLAGKRPAALVTFGSPRVTMSGRIARLLTGVQVRRYVNGDDCVPRLPWMLGLYRHVGGEVAVGRPRHPFGDHRINAYRQALRDRPKTAAPAGGRTVGHGVGGRLQIEHHP